MGFIVSALRQVEISGLNVILRLRDVSFVDSRTWFHQTLALIILQKRSVSLLGEILTDLALEQS